MRPRLLALFCGAGGDTAGYQRAGFHVTGVDINPQPHYCGDEFHQADAMTFPLDGYNAIHAGRPSRSSGTATAKSTGTWTFSTGPRHKCSPTGPTPPASAVPTGSPPPSTTTPHTTFDDIVALLEKMRHPLGRTSVTTDNRAKNNRPDPECIARDPNTKRNCPYSLYCAFCDLDDDLLP